MKGRLGITLLVLFVSLLRPAPAAAAGFWAWLEEWSGPGPFGGYTFLFTACVQDGTFKASPIARDDKFHRQQELLARRLHDASPGQQLPTARAFRRLLANPDPLNLALKTEVLFPVSAPPPSPTTPPQSTQAEREPAGRFPWDRTSVDRELSTIYASDAADRGPGHEDKRLICGFVDQGFFEAKRNPTRGFPAIRAHLTDFGPSLRLHDGVDVGAGMGWVSFKGDGVDVPRHLIFTPIRVILRPITMAVPEEHRERWMGVLNFYWKETYFVGNLNARDFGSRKDTFAVNGELIRSVGLNFDITALLPPKWGVH